MRFFVFSRRLIVRGLAVAGLLVALQHAGDAQAPSSGISGRSGPSTLPAVPANAALKRRYVAGGIANSVILPAALQADLQPSQNGGPLKIGFNRDIPSALAGTLESRNWAWAAANDGLVAALSVRSPGAAALRLGLEVRDLPPNTELRFFGFTADAEVFGPFTAVDVLPQTAGPAVESGRRFWSPIVSGDTIAVEIFVPAASDVRSVSLTATSVSHLLMNPALEEQDFLKISNPCEIDVACYPAWDAQARAVARMSFTENGSTFLCTGTLLNDRGGTLTPYFLSANHCIDTSAVAATLNTFWFEQRTSCGGGSTAPATRLTRGATLLATSPGTDFTLLRLNEPAPAGAFFAGWRSESVAPGLPVAGIHHPQGDPKKISLGSLDGVAGYLGPATGSGTHLKVTWSQGLTEGGSSGSGLFADDGTGQLLGILSGGTLACSGANDWYGRFQLIHPQISQYLDAGPPTTQTRVIALAGNLAFGDVSIGTTATRTLTIANTGNAALIVTGLAFPGGFSGGFAGTIAAGGSQPVTVSFTPTEATSYGGTVIVNANQTGGTNTIAASGRGSSGGGGGTRTAPGQASVEFNSDCSVTLRWPAATGPVTQYVIVAQVNGVPAGTYPLGSEPSVRSGALLPATYQVVVRALFIDGTSLDGPPSTWVHTCGSPGTPPPPAGPSSAPSWLPHTVTASTVTLNWTSTQGATAYDIEATVQATGQVLNVPVGNQTSLVVANVPPGSYVLRIRGRSSTSAGPYSSPLTVIVGGGGGAPPPAPGPTQITLTWNTTADMDLHLIEPGGAHVYWNSRSGPTAQLEADDLDGFGPERTVIRTPAPGIYQVYIVEYSGAATTATVTITVNAGTASAQTVSYTIQAGGGSPAIGYNVANVNAVTGQISPAAGTRVADLRATDPRKE